MGKNNDFAQFFKGAGNKQQPNKGSNVKVSTKSKVAGNKHLNSSRKSG